MKERPILFKGEMVRAILAGRKTQTRRIVKDTGFYAIDANIHGPETAARELKNLATQCPHGVPGDRLWVKETYSAPGCFRDDGLKIYRADLGDDGVEPHGFKWRPSIFMSRRASRITLELTAVRVERLNDISDQDAIAEGVESCRPSAQCAIAYRDYMQGRNDPFEWFSSPRHSYRSLWEAINGAGSWAANPWVFVETFRRIAP